MNINTAPSGFSQPVFDSQATFRALAAALAEPGLGQPITSRCAAPAQLNKSVAAIALTLVDFDTSLHLESKLATDKAVIDFFAFQTAAPLTQTPGDAAFAIAGHDGNFPDPAHFHQGLAEYPDRSTTLIVLTDVAAKSAQAGTVVLSGPGIRDTRSLIIPGVSDNYWQMIKASRTAFPLGVDILFVHRGHVFGLPRSTRIQLEGIG